MAYLGFHFGGVQNFSGKVGMFAWRETPCSAWRSHAFARGFGGMLPRENFKKWCNLVRFREYFAKKFCQKIILKIVIFYIKITDNVLLRTIFKGIAAYTPQISYHLCDLVCFGVQFL